MSGTSTFLDFQSQNHSFERLAVSSSWQPILGHEQAGERLKGRRVSSDFFSRTENAAALRPRLSSRLKIGQGSNRVVYSLATRYGRAILVETLVLSASLSP